jgi:hypothetical protein
MKRWNFLDFIIEMTKLSRFIMQEMFCKGNNFKHLCKHVVKLLEGNLEMHKHGATTIQEGNLKRMHKEDGIRK